MIGLAAFAAGCGDGDDVLSPDLVETTASMVQERATAASVDLAPVEAACAARQLTDDDSAALTDLSHGDEPLTEILADHLATSILQCVDSDLLARSALAPLTTGADDDSIECVAGRLGDRLTQALIAANLRQVPMPAAQVELQVATAFGLCFDPVELLDRG